MSSLAKCLKQNFYIAATQRLLHKMIKTMKIIRNEARISAGRSVVNPGKSPLRGHDSNLLVY